MPVYEYRCAICKDEIEALQNLSDPPLVRCKNCDNDSLYKLVSAPHGMVVGNPKSVGMLMEQNTRKMGTYEKEELNRKNKEGKKEPPWWGKAEKRKRSLNR